MKTFAIPGLMALLALVLSANAFALQPGDTLPELSLEDAGGTDHTLDEAVRRIYLSGDRKSGNLIKEAMDGRDQATLDAQQAIVIAEISAAPGFVKRMIRSSLKDRSYTTWVDTKGRTKQALPYRPDRVTVLDLDARRVLAIRYHAELDGLRQELQAPLTPAPESATP